MQNFIAPPHCVLVKYLALIKILNFKFLPVDFKPNQILFYKVFILNGLALMLSFSSVAQYALNGETNVCPDDLEVYTVTWNPLDDPPYSYEYSATGGAAIQTNNNTITIAWGVPGSGIVSVDLFDDAGASLGSLSLNVTIHDLPNPVMLTSFDAGCTIYEEREGEIVPTIDPNDCYTVCENSIVTYTVTNNPGSYYLWSVTGDITTVVNHHEITVEWGPVGNGTVSVTETNAGGCSSILEKCVNIVETPVASFSTQPPSFPGTSTPLVVCLEQPISFEGIYVQGMSPITDWLWDFGDGTNEITQYPTHLYTDPGTYIVTLTVTNECNCVDVIELEVIVENAYAVDIECITPVCANDTFTYYTTADCNPFNWVVTNGQILTPNPGSSNTITIAWNNGSNGPGIISLGGNNCDGGCDHPTVVEVPILSPTSTITGPAPACVGEQEKYYVPLVPGTQYVWTIFTCCRYCSKRTRNK